MFNSNASLLPVLPDIRVFKLRDRGFNRIETYQAIEARMRAAGIDFVSWRGFGSGIDNSFLEGKWNDYWTWFETNFPDSPPRPGTFFDVYGNGLLPATLDVADHHGDFSPDLYQWQTYTWSEWLYLLSIAEGPYEGAPTSQAFIRYALGMWVVNGMFQLTICLTLLNCFNLDNRGRKSLTV